MSALSSLAPYLAWARNQAPPWLSRPLAAAWHEAMGLSWDIAKDAANKAIYFRFVATAPDDALPLIASERSLEAMPGEGPAPWRERLASAWADWPWAGTKAGVLTALVRTGLPNVALYEYWDWPNGPASRWARFWIVISKPHPWTAPIRCGRMIITRRRREVPVAGGGYLCGIGSATADQIARLRRLTRQWKPAHAHCEAIRIVVGGLLAGTGAIAGTPGTVAGAQVVTLSV